jgi:hypothetical protein
MPKPKKKNDKKKNEPSKMTKVIVALPQPIPPMPDKKYKIKKYKKTPMKRVKKLAPMQGKTIKETTVFQATPGGSTMTHASPGKARKAKERVKQKATIARGKRRDIKSIRKEKRKQIKKIRGR